MRKTIYDEAGIDELRRKYKRELIALRSIFMIMYVAVILGENLIPVELDTYSFFDENNVFHYYFNILPLIKWTYALLMIIIFFLIYSIVFKAILKERYYEFCVAESKKNISLKQNKIIHGIFILLLLIPTVFSVRNIGCVTVNDNGFTVVENVFSDKKESGYGFDFFEEKKFLFDTSGNVGFGHYEFPGIWRKDFEFGKYSEDMEILVKVIDEKTNHKYNLSDIGFSFDS